MTEVSLKLNKNEHVKVAKNDSYVNFTRIGNGTMNKTSNIESIDLIKMMVDMTKPEIKAISLLIESVPWEYDTTENKYYTLGVVYLPASAFKTQADRLMFQKGVKNLKDKDLVRKSGRNDYMLNPLAVLPTNSGEAMRLWNTLKETE